MIALVKSYSFDGDGQVKLFKDNEYDKATKELKESFDKYLKAEENDNTDYDKENTFCNEKYAHAKFIYNDGECVEWQILNVCNRNKKI